jgi:hypothetical protein
MLSQEHAERGGRLRVARPFVGEIEIGLAAMGGNEQVVMFSPRRRGKASGRTYVFCHIAARVPGLRPLAGPPARGYVDMEYDLVPFRLMHTFDLAFRKSAVQFRRDGPGHKIIKRHITLPSFHSSLSFNDGVFLVIARSGATRQSIVVPSQAFAPFPLY